MLFEEHAEEVYRLFFAVSIQPCILAEVWRVELPGVLYPNDVVEEASGQKEDGLLMMITWPVANIF